MNRLNGHIPDSKTLYGKLAVQSQVLNGKIRISNTTYIHDRYPDYTGSYRAIPTVDEQVFETAQKSMLEDMVVEAVPYQEVSNPYGTTVSICS